MINSPFKTIVTGLFLLSATASVAQKKQYTMAEATNGIATTLAPKSIKSPAWRPGTHQFYYRDDKGVLKLYNADTRDTIINKACCEGMTDRRAGSQWLKANSDFYFINDTLSVHYYNKKSDGVMQSGSYNTTIAGAANVHVDPTTNGYAYTKDNNLYYSVKNENQTAVTADANKDIVNGQAVHRNEFGINDGIFFSPQGNYLAYYRMDQSMVKDYPVIDWSTVPAKNENVKYPMAGDSSHQVTVRIYNIATRKTVELNTGKGKDHYLTTVTWSPDERYIYVAILNRGQNHLWLNKYDAKTGEKVKTLLEETNDKYVEPQHPLAFIPGSNTQFIWWSQRDGYMHLWLCDMEKNSMRCLTPGNYVVNEIIGFINTKRTEVLFTAAKEDPREKHGYAVNITNGAMRRLDTEPGTHTYTASDDGRYFYDVFSNSFSGSQNATDNGYGVTRKSVIRDEDGKILKVLLDAPNPLKDYDRPTISSKVLKASDGTPLYGTLILPTNFDEHKKYPVIVYLYNGPHVQLVKNAFPASGNLWYEYMAQHGYIVWVMDGRGSSNRGFKFESATFRHLGTVEMEDQLKGVEYLKSLPYVDASRMGVHGWSFGGFMTTSLMLRHPGIFKAAVAGGPVMDWRMYEIMYGERYMDTPQENPEGYKESALYDKVKNLKGKLLLIHGAQDATVVWQHSIKFLKAAVDGGVQVDYFVYPGYEHNVRGKDRVHLMQKITDYFDSNL